MSKPVPARARRLALVLLPLLALAAGCGGGADDAGCALERPPLRLTSDPDVRPVIVCDLVAVNAWLDLVERVRAGETPPEADVAQVLSTPAYRLVVDDGPESGLRPRVVARALETVFAPGADSVATGLIKTRYLDDNYIYVRGRLDRVAADLAERFSRERLDAVRDDLLAIAPAADWPPEIGFEIFAGKPLISHGPPARFAVDLGLALAGGPGQITRLLAGRVYHALGRVDGVRPDLAPDPRAKLEGTLRMLRHDGVAAWLARKPEVFFDPAHLRLGGVPRGEPAALDDAAVLLDRVMDSLDVMLTPLTPHLIDQYGDRIDQTLRRNERYESVGWAMARLIADDLGEAGLFATAGDTEAFFRAYQAAALAPRDDPALDRLPAFPDALFDDVMTLLARP